MTQFAIGGAPNRSGVIVEMIRYREREGSVPAAAPTASRRRVYSPRNVAHLRFLKRLRDLGFPIFDLKALLGRALDNAPHCAEARPTGENSLELVRAKIADMRSLEKTIEALFAHCTDGWARCPMLDDLLAEKRPLLARTGRRRFCALSRQKGSK